MTNLASQNLPIIGFASIDLAEIFIIKKPIRENCEAKAIFLSDGQKAAAWVVLDFMDFDLSAVNMVKCAVQKATDIPLFNIHIVTTHNHGCSTCDEIDMKCLSRLAAEAAVQAKNAAKCAKMRFACTEVSQQVNYMRRIFVPEVKSKATCFFGITPEEGFDSSPFVENFLQSLKEGKLSWCGTRETSLPSKPFPSGDAQIWIVEFRELDNNKPLGCILRFAAHAVCCNRPDSYSSDYPWHFRENIAKVLGGTAIFMNGPCADIAPCIKDKKSGGEIWLGDILAREALNALSSKSFEPFTHFEDAISCVRLPVRKEVQENHVANLQVVLPEDLPARKETLEHASLASTLPFLRSKYVNGETSLTDTIEIELGRLQLNKLNILAYPGETFSTTAFNSENVITVTEHGRTVMYIPPDEERRLGGYESVCSVTAAGAESILKQEAEKLIQKDFG